MRSLSLSLFAVVAASGCAGARWTVADSRPVIAVAVGPAETHGAADATVAAAQRQALIEALRVRGYSIVDDGDRALPGVARIALSFDGARVSDAQMHAPDDKRHNIYNDLSYSFVAYKVRLEIIGADGSKLAEGAGEANGDPSGVMKKLTERLVNDVPPSRTDTFAKR